jgi:amino acid transporter
MNNVWLKFKVWTKVVLVTLALVYVISFSVKNSEPQAKATFWYFYNSPVMETQTLETSTFKLVAGSFVAGILVTLLARTTFRTIAQIRELRARQAAEARDRDIEQIRSKAAMLRVKPDPTDVDADVPADLK